MAVELSEREAGYIEGYAAALQRMLHDLTGDNGCSKSYDPMTVDLESGVMHSYAFDMKDGGRHHPLTDYSSIDEVCDILRMEAVGEIRESELGD